MRALFVSCTLKKSPERSNTETLGAVVADALAQQGVEVDHVRLADLDVPPGVVTDVGDGDEWPGVHERLLDAEILVVLTLTWLGRPSSIAQRMLERMDAMMTETADDGTPVAYNRVTGVVVTGNEDGAHHVISEVSGALADLGYTVPGQAWTYWNQGPGPGDDYVSTEHGHDWAQSTARLMAHNLHAVAAALAARPVPPPG
ncbi:multimeric flavodoxin WrbA [Isoptericola sp. CG 20/1183]|uniref:Multimeric flavodoxin WrbA n=1 Tax=Isoptericola halotolerans TaxID=300560 RepID=A0ABX5E9Y0_9MICO|nr:MULTISPECIES: NAD(P)H-dependent oxidoreductase [Isoptericola]PRZ02667.1 multimeric flavodoxin WrbA [Isoptericola sp. CG 20/1183]PRZ03019.1 multimeric flavodoxin WrbA [Isoptericola halotolerans]